MTKTTPQQPTPRESAPLLPAGSFQCATCGNQLHLYASFSAAQDRAALAALGWQHTKGQWHCHECSAPPSTNTAASGS